MKRILSILLSAVMTVSSGMIVQAETGSAEFDRFMDQEFIDTLASDYLTMHYSIRDYKSAGIEKPELTVGDAGWDSFQEAVTTCQEGLDRLKQFSYESLSDTQKRDYDVYQYYTECMRDMNRYPQAAGYFDPGSGIHDILLTDFTEFVFYEKEDVSDYLTVLEDVPNYLDDALEVTKRQAENGFFLTDSQLDETLDSIQKFTAKKEDNELIVVFNNNMDSLSFLSEQEKKEYREKNREIVLNRFIPAYEKVSKQLEALRGSRSFEGGLCNYEDGGEEYYQALVKYKTGSSASIESQLHEMGYFMMDLIDEYVELYEADPFLDSKYETKTVKLKTPEEILSYHQNHLQDYPEGPEVSYQSSYLDKSVATDTVIAYYMTPPLDDYRNNVIKINGSNIEDENSLYETLAHEGFPGHLYQTTWYLSQNPSRIRTIIDQIGYSEGWGMYAEVSSWDNAGLDQNVQRLHQIWTTLAYCEDAAVDLGVNGLGWSIEDTAEWLESIGFNPDSAESLYEYVMDHPGLILPYGFGLMRFLKLRSTAEQFIGSGFSRKEFNEVLLSGGPRQFDLVETDVERYIEEKTGIGSLQQGGAASAKPEQPGGEEIFLPWEEASVPRRPSGFVPALIGAGVFAVLLIAGIIFLNRHRKKDPLA